MPLILSYGPPEAVRVPLCGGIRGRVGQRCVAHQPQAQDPALPTLGIDQLEQGASAPMMEVLLHRDEGLPSPRAQRIVPSPRVRRPTPLVGHLCFDLLFSDEKPSSACNYGVWRRGDGGLVSFVADGVAATGRQTLVRLRPLNATLSSCGLCVPARPVGAHPSMEG